MRIHIVQRGDTLFEIAKQYGVNFEELVRLNSQLSSPDMIMPGMKIKVPGESKQVRSTPEQTTRTAPAKAERVEPTRREPVKAERVEPARREPVTPAKEQRIEPVKKEHVAPVKEKRVEPMKEEKQFKKEARPIERPMGKEVADERGKVKHIQPKLPHQLHTLYPTRPIVEQPKKVKYEEMPKEVKGAEYTKDEHYMKPERMEFHTKPMREPLPIHQAMQHAVQCQYPVYQPTCHCCSCCRCRRRPSPSRCGCSSGNYQRGFNYGYQPYIYNQYMGSGPGSGGSGTYYYPQGNQLY